MRRSPLKAFAFILSALLCMATAARAEDIDLYAGIGGNAMVPNVLFVLDNAADFDASAPDLSCTYADGSGSPSMAGTLAGIEQCALFNAVYSLPPDAVNIGLMGYNANQFTTYSCTSGGKAGCLLRPITFMTAANKVALENWIKTWALSPSDPLSIKANSEAVASTMQEAWAYYAGKTGLSGRDYASIQPPSGCQKNFVIFIGNAFGSNGKPSDGGSVSASAALQSAPGVTQSQLAPINVPYPQGAACNTSNPYYTMPNHTDSSGLWADEWSRYMYQSDLYSNLEALQRITTYTIGVLGAACKPDFPALMTSMARYGGGKYYAAHTYDELYQAILQILNEVQAINSVFASASLPVSVNAQGTYQNQVFMGMFRPDANGLVRWAGNLKQYQFGVSGNDPRNVQLYLADATGAQAISSAGTGFISPNAVSFWTGKDTSKLPDLSPPAGFWANNAQGVSLAYDSVDGEIVEKGGVSQQIRLANLTTDYAATPLGPRNVFTCNGACTTGSSLSSTPFATTNANLTEATLGIANPIYNIAVSSITRDSASKIVTVTLASTPSPPITLPTSIVITGSTDGQFDGSLASYSPSASGTTITYTLATAIPSTPVTPNSPTTYTVSGTSALLSSVTSLTRGTGAGLITATAVLSDLTFGGGATVAVNDGVTISGSNGYDLTATVLSVNTSTRTITFKMQDSPATVGGDNGLGLNFYIGASCVTSGSNPNCDTIGPSNTSAPGVVRGTNCTTCSGVSSTDQVLMINFWGGSNKIGSPAVGNIAKLQNVTPSNYNNITTGYQVVGTGTNCRVSYTMANGTVQSYIGIATSNKVYSVCLALGASFPLTPSLSGNGALSGTIATRPNAGLSRQIKTLTRGLGNCVNGVGDATATATATTMTAHGFSNQTVTITTTSPVDSEKQYTGTNIPITVTGTDTFTYTIPVLPKCSDTKAGMRVYYQTSTGGISATDLIRWARGADNAGDELGPGYGITVRPSVHGDVLHSRPVVVNYGGSTGVVVFYGANDGAFHAVNGNQPPRQGSSAPTSIGTTPPGGELWSFIPTEFYPKLQRMFRNSPVMHLFTTPQGLSPTPTPKEYFFDGITGVYQHQDSAGNTDKAYIFLSARRGGRLLYALDVTNPADPKFLWKRSCPNLTDNNGCDAGFAELGQTWSQPKAAFVKGFVDGSGNPKPVVIVGAGYYGGYNASTDTYYGEDATPPTANNLMGRGIFILDAATGCILWQAGPSPTSGGLCAGGAIVTQADMVYPMAADLTLVNRDYDKYGFIDRIYAADTGGNIWRVDLEPTGGSAPGNWQVIKFASLGGSDATKRKFLYAPDVVSTKNYDLVLAITGDREHPLYANTSTFNVVNKFYALYDTKTGKDASGWTTITDSSAPTSSTAPSTFFNASSTAVPINDWQAHSGFYFAFQNPGEKGVNAPTTIGGFTYFGTSQPTIPGAPNSCKTVLGTARGYQVNILRGTNSDGLSAAGHPVEFAGGGLAPSPIAGLVNVTVNGRNSVQPFIIGAGGVPGQGMTAGGETVPGCSGADCTSAIGALRPPIPITNTRRRIYWYLDKHDN